VRTDLEERAAEIARSVRWLEREEVGVVRLTLTLHELERLQAKHQGEEIPSPAVTDVNVTVDTGPA
jgi:hypothetical protein